MCTGTKLQVSNPAAATNRKEVILMEELQKTLVAKIGEQLKSDKPNIQYLDVLNRLLGTVSDFILSDN